MACSMVLNDMGVSGMFLCWRGFSHLHDCRRAGRFGMVSVRSSSGGRDCLFQLDGLSMVRSRNVVLEME